MARQLRIEFPGAFYHVTSRGNQKQTIFFDDNDRTNFIARLEEAHEKFTALFHAYCLMGNHFHLLLETPLGNLSKTMHFINTSYTVFFNNRHSRSGHLLQGRFKAILVQKESYALALSRYIHLNPIRAHLVSRPEQYPWSSYNYFTGQKAAPSWLTVSFILEYFSPDSDRAGKMFGDFVTEAIETPPENPLKNAYPCLILGSEEYIKKIGRNYASNIQVNAEIPALKRLHKRCSMEEINNAIVGVFGHENRLVRNIGIFVARKNTNYSSREIAEFYRLRRSAIAYIYKKTEDGLSSNRELAETVSVIERNIFN